MLRDRRDAAELLELLDFHPPDWRRYYEDLWSRYPTLAEGWIHVGFLNLPTAHVPEKWERDLKERRRRVVEEREHQDLLMIAEIRGKVLGLMVKRGADRVRAQLALDRRLADFGLRPKFSPTPWTRVGRRGSEECLNSSPPSTHFYRSNAAAVT